MVDFKFYFISIIAIFLALSLGILLGSVIVGQQEQPISEKLIKSIESDVERVRLENQLLVKENKEKDQFIKEAYPLLIKGRLTEAKVCVIYFSPADRKLVDNISSFLREASARSGLVEFDFDVFSQADLTETSGLLAVKSQSETSFAVVFSELLARLTTPTPDLPSIFSRLDFIELRNFKISDLPFDFVVLVLPYDNFKLKQLSQVKLPAGSVVVLDRKLADSNEVTLPSFSSTMVYGVDTLPGKVALVFSLGGQRARLGYGQDQYFLTETR